MPTIPTRFAPPTWRLCVPIASRPAASRAISKAPDLAVEVVSPSDRPDEVAAKVQEWLQAGCSMVWVVQPDSRTVAVHRRGHEVTALKGPDALVGGDVLPEFSMPVTTIFG